MKYIIILLFLFSTHSFSGEADGKGIDCKPISDKTKIKSDIMFWFNNGKVVKVGLGMYISSNKKTRIPESINITEAIFDGLPQSTSYSSNYNEIKWKSPDSSNRTFCNDRRSHKKKKIYISCNFLWSKS